MHSLRRCLNRADALASGRFCTKQIGARRAPLCAVAPLQAEALAGVVAGAAEDGGGGAGAGSAVLPLPPVLLGIDPDLGGALVVLEVTEWPGAGALTLSGTPLEVHDMPVERRPMGRQVRRWVDARAVADLLATVVARHGRDGLCAVLEAPTPNALNGKFSWFGCGFAFGVWSGALRAHGVQTQTVGSRQWKNDLRLNGKGKEGSRELATALFPSSASLLRRKKDHGRAEAMLIAAWGLGLRVAADSSESRSAAEAGAGGAGIAAAAELQSEGAAVEADVLLAVGAAEAGALAWMH
ncbi:hypothetical protein WJX81_000483 [Elliptochloris bilobata]|uniref:Holliday junction resolvase RuvC n=1 Tax=Elliptochloris bilobata TaxID=381761 RepID=A0AAW1RUU1_9CHLO